MITTFTKKIEVESNFTPEFFFNRIYMAGGTHFHVSVIDKPGNICHFTMIEKESKWRIVNAPQPPEWIMNFETELDEIICRGMLS